MRTGLVDFVRGESIRIEEHISVVLEVLPHIRHHRVNDGEVSGTGDFVFGATALYSLYPEWKFPDRRRDIHALALELEKLRESSDLS